MQLRALAKEWQNLEKVLIADNSLANSQIMAEEELLMNETSRKTLELFIEKAEKLREYLSKEGNHFGGLIGIYSSIGEDDWQRYPELDGFVNTFRWFLLSTPNGKFDISLYPSQRDGTPKRPRLLDLADVSDAWKKVVEKAWEAGNAFLKLELIDIEEPITRQKVLEVFIYGDIVHPTQRETFLEWQRNPDLYGKLSLHFTSSLAFMFFEWILPVAEATRQELRREVKI